MMAPIAFVIAWPDGSAIGTAWIWVSIPLAAVLVVLLYILRRMALEKSHRLGDEFTIEQIDRLRDEGALTDEEYRLARRAVLGLNNPDALEK